jgi:hypothetical protein
MAQREWHESLHCSTRLPDSYIRHRILLVTVPCRWIWADFTTNDVQFVITNCRLVEITVLIWYRRTSLFLQKAFFSFRRYSCVYSGFMPWVHKYKFNLSRREKPLTLSLAITALIQIIIVYTYAELRSPAVCAPTYFWNGGSCMSWDIFI